MAKKYDLETVRQAAAGCWLDLLSSVGGIDPSSLDGKHGPCPKCGGQDRFRLLDESVGAVICNQCHNKKNGDGFAAVQWALGCSFPEAVAKVAEHLGVAPQRRTKADPAKDLQWVEWSSALAQMYVAKNPGVTEAAILAAGGRMAKYKRSYAVIAFPIIGHSLDVSQPAGWLIVNATGRTLPKFDKQGTVVGEVKKKLTYGSEPGLIGLHGIERLKLDGLVDCCWKCEGLTDLLALMSAIPEGQRDRHVVVTNSNGATQGLGWMAGVLARVPVHVIHDCDKPGQAGAEKACKDISAQGGSAKNVVLPYAIEKDHGKDVRDWLNEGNSYSDLRALAERSTVIEIKRTASGERDYTSESWPIQEQILQKLQIEILYEENNGTINIFSKALGKSVQVLPGALDRMKKASLIRMFGPPAMFVVSKDPDGINSWDITDICEAIALIASFRRESHNERGVGIWRGQREDGGESDVLVLANGREAARIEPGGDLERCSGPRTDGLIVNLGSGHEDWFDFETLQRHVREAKDRAWCDQVLETTREIFSRWRWPHPEAAPALLTGLTIASWVQTIWRWRPLVSVIGKTGSGKSMLFEMLGGQDDRLGIYGRLALLSSKSTEAGIRQTLGNTGRVILCDEFEDSKDRERALEMFRASTRGSAVARGTSDQRGRSYTMRHLVWVAATESGLKKQPDLNRFIQFNPLVPEKSRAGELVLPDSQSLVALGQKLLALAIVYGPAAAELAARLKKTKVAGIDDRLIESYAVPAAMLAKCGGESDDEAKAALIELLETVDREEQGQGDAERLVEDILSAQINCGAADGFLTVSQIVSDAKRWEAYKDRVEASGVTFYWTEDVLGDRQSYLTIAHNKVGRTLLRDTEWKNKKLSDLLKHIRGADPGQKKLAKVNVRCYRIPVDITQSGTSADFE